MAFRAASILPLMRKLLVLAAILAAVIAVSGCGSDSEPKAAGLIVAGQATPPPWKPDYTQLARRARLLGIPDPGKETFHIHEMLHIYNDGILVPVGELIGLDVPHKVLIGLHTHVAAGSFGSPGVIHMEADKPFKATLGAFFSIWGVKFGGGWLGGLHAGGKNTLRTFVNGKAISDPAAYVLRKNDNIVIAFGSTNDFPRLPDTTPLKNANSGKGGCALGTTKHPATSCVKELLGKK